MRKLLEKLTRLPAMLAVVVLIITIFPLRYYSYAHESPKGNPAVRNDWGSLNLLISIYVLEFDPNLCGVRFDTSLLRSDDMSSIYRAIKEKIVYKDGKKPVGTFYPKDGPYIRLTQDVKKGEVVPLRFREESLVRIICDFRVGGLGFEYSCVDPKIKDLADSTISLVVFADDDIVDSLRSVLATQSYVKFVARFGLSMEGGFRSITP